jgi:phenylacetic acid degradation protein
MVYSFEGHIPVIDETSFVHPQAVVTGNVIIGKNCYIGPGAALCGDRGLALVSTHIAQNSILPIDL